MDELAEQLGLDPIELRVRNEPERDPELNIPFSSRNLIACMREGAERFGWRDRPAKPGSRREGRKLIGYGMAAAIRANYLGPGSARVGIDTRGEVTVQADMTDIGTGTYTILAQVAAERLGVPLSAVKVELGDSRLPRAAGSGGSWGATSSGTAVHNACLALCERIATAAVSHERSPLRGANIAEARFAGGELRLGSRSEKLADVIAKIAPDGLREIVWKGSIIDVTDPSQPRGHRFDLMSALLDAWSRHLAEWIEHGGILDRAVHPFDLGHSSRDASASWCDARRPAQTLARGSCFASRARR